MRIRVVLKRRKLFHEQGWSQFSQLISFLYVYEVAVIICNINTESFHSMFILIYTFQLKIWFSKSVKWTYLYSKFKLVNVWLKTFQIWKFGFLYGQSNKKPYLTNPVFCVFRMKVKILYRLHLSSVNSLGARTQNCFTSGVCLTHLVENWNMFFLE